jgi:hypothetical protein
VKGDAKAMIKEADTNNEGAIDFLSFSAMMAKKMANVLSFLGSWHRVPSLSLCPLTPSHSDFHPVPDAFVLIVLLLRARS